MSEPTFLVINRQRIAMLLHRPAKPTRAGGVVWLPGLKSEMTSTKASALAAWAEREGIACTRLDYSGHGQSSGKFEDGRISHWLDEVDAVVTGQTQGPQVLVGSSTGGCLALLLLKRFLAQGKDARIKALVLIAPAWDLTTRLMWDRFPDSARRDLMEKGVYLRPSNYGDGPYAITRGFIEDGHQHTLWPDGYNPGRRIIVLHGLQDEDVPWEHTLDLVAMMHGDHVEVEARPDGDHRLSTPDDIELMLEKVSDAIGT